MRKHLDYIENAFHSFARPKFKFAPETRMGKLDNPLLSSCRLENANEEAIEMMPTIDIGIHPGI